MNETWKSIKIPSYTTIYSIYRLKFKPLAATKPLCCGPKVKFRSASNIWNWFKERFNFNDGDNQYDTKYVSDHIDNKYNKNKLGKTNHLFIC